MVVLKNGLLLNGIFYAVLGLVRGLLRLEVSQTAGVLTVFQQVDNGICRPFALIAGVIAAGAARPAVFQRTRRGDLLLRLSLIHVSSLPPTISSHSDRIKSDFSDSGLSSSE